MRWRSWMCLLLCAVGTSCGNSSAPSPSSDPNANPDPPRPYIIKQLASGGLEPGLADILDTETVSLDGS